MGKFVGLLSSSIGLAMEASTQSPNKGTRKRTTSHYRQDFASHDIYHDENQDQKDAKAFQELQSYADFQRVLSNRVQDDIFRDEKYTPIDPQILQGQAFGDYFSHQPYVHPSLQQLRARGALACPVIIPQRGLGDSCCGWVRAYAPVLNDFGIDQYTFLNFLEAFNESSKSSPSIDAVNIVGLGVDFARTITPMIISMALSVALYLEKTAEIAKNSTSFLSRANNDLFEPHGLFAMVVTYKPTTTSQTCTVDVSQSPPTHQAAPYNGSPQLPTSAPLIYPESEPTGSISQQNKLKQISQFIAEYGDRRARGRHGVESSELSPPSKMRSWSGDPNSLVEIGPFVSVTDQKKKERKGRRRQKIRTEITSPGGERQGQRSGLVGSMKGMVSGPGKAEKGFLSRLNERSMKEDVLYLFIVNAPSPTSLTPFATPPTPITQESYPYREAKRVKSPPAVLEPDLFQQWTPDSGVGWLPNDRYGHQSAAGSREQSPPPAYTGPRKSIQRGNISGLGEIDYCAPML